MHDKGRISSRSEGIFASQNWFEEGDGLLASSKKVREVWDDHKEMIKDNYDSYLGGKRPDPEHLSLLRGLPRASMLLLGYASEMYLKAGLTKVYAHCSTTMFDRDLRKRFGHKLFELAEEIAFPITENDEANFRVLSNMILADARYPVDTPVSETFTKAKNQQTRRMSNKDLYRELVDLVERIRSHALRIDSDSDVPADFITYNIDEDGYFVFRRGGHLPTRITYRLSERQKAKGETSLEEIKSMFDPNIHKMWFQYWDEALIFEDGEKKTIQKTK